MEVEGTHSSVCKLCSGLLWFLSSWCNSLEDQVPLDEINGHSKSPCSVPRTYFTHRLWTQSKSYQNMSVLARKMTIWSDHNFAHAMTAQLSWHVQNCELIGSLDLELERKVLSQNLNSNDELKTCLWNGPLQGVPAMLSLRQQQIQVNPWWAEFIQETKKEMHFPSQTYVV